MNSVPSGFPKLFFIQKQSFYLKKPVDLFSRKIIDFVSLEGDVSSFDHGTMESDIGIIAEVDIDTLLNQLQDLINAIENKNDLEKIGNRSVNILNNIYSEIGKLYEKEKDDTQSLDLDGIITRFKNIKCVVDSNKFFWKPKHVFLPGYSFGDYRARIEQDDLTCKGLEILGCSKSPSAEDFKSFFDDVYERKLSSKLSPEEQGFICDAFNAASISPKATEELLGTPILTNEGFLLDPDRVVFDDSPLISERAKNSHLVFLNQNLLEIVVDVFSVNRLSKTIRQVQTGIEKNKDPSFEAICKKAQNIINSNHFIFSIKRLLNATSYDLTKLNELELDWLFGLRIEAVGSLKTILVWTEDDSLIENSEGEGDVLFDRQKISSMLVLRGPRSFTNL